jgi:hypothetical protein
MPLINREKDGSEQRNIYNVGPLAIGTGTTTPILIAQNNEQLLGFQVMGFGLSGTPVLTFQIGRFVVGKGFTMLNSGFSAITIGATFGASGMPTGLTPITQLTIGSTLNTMQPNDLLFVVSSGANSNGTYLAEIVTQNLQDIRTTYGF